MPTHYGKHDPFAGLHSFAESMFNMGALQDRRERTALAKQQLANSKKESEFSNALAAAHTDLYRVQAKALESEASHKYPSGLPGLISRGVGTIERILKVPEAFANLRRQSLENDKRALDNAGLDLELQSSKLENTNSTLKSLYGLTKDDWEVFATSIYNNPNVSEATKDAVRYAVANKDSIDGSYSNVQERTQRRWWDSLDSKQQAMYAHLREIGSINTKLMEQAIGLPGVPTQEVDKDGNVITGVKYPWAQQVAQRTLEQLFEGLPGPKNVAGMRPITQGTQETPERQKVKKERNFVSPKVVRGIYELLPGGEPESRRGSVLVAKDRDPGGKGANLNELSPEQRLVWGDLIYRRADDPAWGRIVSAVANAKDKMGAFRQLLGTFGRNSAIPQDLWDALEKKINKIKKKKKRSSHYSLTPKLNISPVVGPDDIARSRIDLEKAFAPERP